MKWFLCLMLLVAAVFWRLLFTPDVLFFRDIGTHHFVRAAELRNIVRGGSLPLWNPFTHFGEPVASNPNYLLFYPTSWLAWLLPVSWGFKLHLVFHFFLLAAGSFLLARRIGLSAPGCFFAGALFVFSGPVMSLGDYQNALIANAWMPLVILAADSLMRRGGWRGATVFAAAVTLQAFAGEPFVSIISFVLAIGWCLAIHTEKGMRRIALRLAAGTALAAGFSAVQLWPAVWRLRGAQRLGLSFENAFYFSLHPLRLFELAVPQLWGNLFQHVRLPWLYLSVSQDFLISVFVGIIPLFFALAAFLIVGDRVSNFWAVAGFAAVAIALGRYTPLSSVFYSAIPFFRIVRFPEKILVVLPLAISQLSGIAADRLSSMSLDAQRQRRLRLLQYLAGIIAAAWIALAAAALLAPGRVIQFGRSLAEACFDRISIRWLDGYLESTYDEAMRRAAIWVVEVIPSRLPFVVVTVLLVIAALYVWRKPSSRYSNVIPLFVLGAAVLQLIVINYGVNPVASPRYYSDRPPALDLLPPARPLRVFTAPTPGFPPAVPLASFRGDPAALEFLPPSARISYTRWLSLQEGAPVWGLETTYGPDYEVFLDAQFSALNNAVVSGWLLDSQLHRVLAMSGVEHMIARRGFSETNLWELTGSAPNYTKDPARVFRISGALPRAYVMPDGDAVILPPGDPSVDYIMSGAFRPDLQLVLDRPAWTEPHPRSLAMFHPAEIVHRDPLRVEIRASANFDSYLVLTDTYDSAWKAKLDGRDVPVLRANQIFRAVPLPPGEHVVVFFYRPWPLLLGALVTILTVLLAAFACVRLGGNPHTGSPSEQ